MKEFLKKHISPWWWQRLRDLNKWRRARARGPWPVGLGEFVGKGVKVLVKEGIEVVGRLDYPKAAIYMAANRAAELTRLNACAKEPETVAWLEKRVKPDDVFYDIGSHVGAYALIAAALAPRGRVFAFEPNPKVFTTLTRNIELNGWVRRMTALPVALGSQSALEPFLTEPLDDVCKTFGLPPPGLVKIDVDGGEAGVVEGAAQTLREPALRTILIEIDETRAGSRALLERLAATGFEAVARHPRAKGGSKTVFNYIFERRAQTL